MRRDRRPLNEREFIFDKHEAASVVGLSVYSIERYAKKYTGWPGFPMTKGTLIAFLQRNKLPKTGGTPSPTPNRRRLVRMVEVDKLPISEAARQFGVSRQAAQQMYRRHMKAKVRGISLERFYAREE